MVKVVSAEVQAGVYGSSGIAGCQGNVDRGPGGPEESRSNGEPGVPGGSGSPEGFRDPFNSHRWDSVPCQRLALG